MNRTPDHRMSAWRLGASPGVEHLEQVELAVPSPGPGEILVRLRASSVNRRDLMVVDGTWRPAPPPLLVPLSEGAGEVVELGSGATGLQVGDRVAGVFSQEWQAGDPAEHHHAATLGAPLPGVLSQWRVFPAHGLVKIPSHLSYEEAACLPVAGVTAWSALFGHDQLAPGGTVLILSSGSVALMATQLAHAAGARTIVASRKPEHRDRLEGLGADHVVQLSEDGAWVQTVLALTGEAGVDLVVDTIGSTLQRSVAAARVGGAVSVVGLLGGVQAELSVVQLLARQPRLHGINVGSRAAFERLNTFLGLHGLHPPVAACYPLSEARAALEATRRGGHFGKIVVPHDA